MDDEIDLRPYVELLLRQWKWVVGASLLSALLALGVGYLIAPTYATTALVAVTEPRQLVQFDPRFEAVEEDSRPLGAYPELAASDELLQDLLGRVNPDLEDVKTLRDLQRMVEAVSGSDPSLVRLTVRYGDPAKAANVANAWAELFVVRANAIFGDQSTDRVQFFESLLEQANAELEAAEEALIDFQARDRESIIDNELSSLRESQARYLAEQRTITFLTQDIKGLRDQLTVQPESNSITFADQLTALSLQLKAFDAQTSASLQFQIAADEPLFNSSRSEQVAFLDTLITTLETTSSEIDERLAELEPRILEMQEQKQEISTEHARLQRDRNVADETYTALARKVEEERITSQDTSSGVQLASRAAVPEKPISPRKLVNAILAGVVAWFAAVLWVLITGWLKLADK